MKTAKQQKAFTLIETLVALTLMSLLIVVLFGGFRVGVRSWQISEDYIASTEEPRQLSALLYRHLGQIVRVKLGGISFSSLMAFESEAERIRYVAPLAMSAGEKYYLFEMINNYEGRGGIWARFAPFVQGWSDDEIFSDAQFMQISKEWSVRFSYFYNQEWLDEMPDGQLPKLVSVQLAAADKQWPSMVFAINASGLEL
jgi:general secretion pathway protein J